MKFEIEVACPVLFREQFGAHPLKGNLPCERAVLLIYMELTLVPGEESGLPSLSEVQESKEALRILEYPLCGEMWTLVHNVTRESCPSSPLTSCYEPRPVGLK